MKIQISHIKDYDLSRFVAAVFSENETVESKLEATSLWPDIKIYTHPAIQVGKVSLISPPDRKYIASN